MSTNARCKPMLGSAFDADQMNEPERVSAYVAQLERYKPAGWRRLAKEGRALEEALWDDAESARSDAWDHADGFKSAVKDLLTAWGRKVSRNDALSFGPFPDTGDVGFMIAVEAL